MTIKKNHIKRTLIAFGALALLAGLFSVRPVRAQVLGVFRAQNFVAVKVDYEHLNAIDAALIENLGFGTDEILKDPGAFVWQDSLEEASARTGVTPRLPVGYGDPTTIAVYNESQSSYTPDVEALQAAFESLGLDPALLPQSIDGQPFTVTNLGGIDLNYDRGSSLNSFSLMQGPAPMVEVPEGVDMQAFSNAMFQLIGMPSAEAETLSASIDWTTTLALPVTPLMASTWAEVNVDGVSGLLFYGPPKIASDGLTVQINSLLWQKDGIVYLVTSAGGINILLDVANSLP